MANNTLGYSFAPTFDAAEEGRRGGSPPLFAQSPMQVLSYRLPKFRGAGGGLSPLQGERGAGGIPSAVLESVLRTVLGPEDTQAWLSGMANGGMTPDRGAAPGGGGTNDFFRNLWTPTPRPTVIPGDTSGDGSMPEPRPATGTRQGPPVSAPVFDEPMPGSSGHPYADSPYAAFVPQFS